MEARNKEEIKIIYEEALGMLRITQKAYEKMLDDRVLISEAKEYVLEKLMEVDYQIRDYENSLLELNEKYSTPSYLVVHKGAIPIIKDDRVRSRLIKYEEKIKEYENVYEHLISIRSSNKDLLRTDFGKTNLTRLVSLDNNQAAIIQEELLKEKNQVDKLTSLKGKRKIYNLLNKFNAVKRELQYKSEALKDLESQPYPSNKKNKLAKIVLNNKVKRLNKKAGNLIGKVNLTIVNRNSFEEKVKTLTKKKQTTSQVN